MTPTTITALLYIATGALIIIVSIPMIRRRIAPNPLYGLRLRATFADEWVWYEANARCGRDLVAVGIAICVLSVLLPLLPGMTAEAFALTHSGIILVLVIAACVVGVRRANRLLADRIARGEELKPVNPFRKGPIRAMRRP